MQPCPQGTDGAATHCHSSNGAAPHRQPEHTACKRKKGKSKKPARSAPVQQKGEGRPPDGPARDTCRLCICLHVHFHSRRWSCPAHACERRQSTPTHTKTHAHIYQYTTAGTAIAHPPTQRHTRTHDARTHRYTHMPTRWGGAGQCRSTQAPANCVRVCIKQKQNMDLPRRRGVRVKQNKKKKEKKKKTTVKYAALSTGHGWCCHALPQQQRCCPVQATGAYCTQKQKGQEEEASGQCPCAAERGGRSPTDLPVIFADFVLAFMYISIRAGGLTLHARAKDAIAHPPTQRHTHTYINTPPQERSPRAQNAQHTRTHDARAHRYTHMPTRWGGAGQCRSTQRSANCVRGCILTKKNTKCQRGVRVKQKQVTKKRKKKKTKTCSLVHRARMV